MSKIFYLSGQSPSNMAEWINGLNASGYAGITKNGMVCDRREFPDAVPMQENKGYGIVAPKPTPTKEVLDDMKKAAKWDALEAKIHDMYIDPETGEERPEEDGYDLLSIGEAAASAFGWM